ncbi:hypothetical protein FKP32DRAFT_1605143 [Trametes sanguinea]|nr:hypothetical protein FKP32DRAFT_1605143 [Trametes sanguinea]
MTTRTCFTISSDEIAVLVVKELTSGRNPAPAQSGVGLYVIVEQPRRQLQPGTLVSLTRVSEVNTEALEDIAPEPAQADICFQGRIAGIRTVRADEVEYAVYNDIGGGSPRRAVLMAKYVEPEAIVPLPPAELSRRLEEVQAIQRNEPRDPDWPRDNPTPRPAASTRDLALSGRRSRGDAQRANRYYEPQLQAARYMLLPPLPPLELGRRTHQDPGRRSAINTPNEECEGRGNVHPKEASDRPLRR